jgi:hypothetical protein
MRPADDPLSESVAAMACLLKRRHRWIVRWVSDIWRCAECGVRGENYREGQSAHGTLCLAQGASLVWLGRSA